jgi:hypothetical protein
MRQEIESIAGVMAGPDALAGHRRRRALCRRSPAGPPRGPAWRSVTIRPPVIGGNRRAVREAPKKPARVVSKWESFICEHAGTVACPALSGRVRAGCAGSGVRKDGQASHRVEFLCQYFRGRGGGHLRSHAESLHLQPPARCRPRPAVAESTRPWRTQRRYRRLRAGRSRSHGPPGGLGHREAIATIDRARGAIAAGIHGRPIAPPACSASSPSTRTGCRFVRCGAGSYASGRQRTSREQICKSFAKAGSVLGMPRTRRIDSSWEVARVASKDVPRARCHLKPCCRI